MGGMAWTGLIPQLPDFAGKGLDYGIFRKMRDDYASQVRHLRRREYQDMMFSMKAAGLNPILASGATPGHSAAMQGSVGAGSPGAGIGSAMAANRQAGVAEKKAPSEIGLNTESSLNKAVERTNLALQPALTSSTIDEIKARTEYAKQQAISEGTKRNLMASQSSAAEAAAKKAEMETPLEQGGAATQPYQAGKRVGGQIAGDVAHTASSAAEVLRLWGNTQATKLDTWWEGTKHKIAESWRNPPNRYHSAKDAQENRR